MVRFRPYRYGHDNSSVVNRTAGAVDQPYLDGRTRKSPVNMRDLIGKGYGTGYVQFFYHKPAILHTAVTVHGTVRLAALPPPPAVTVTRL
jgi:hypothetical protein